MHFRKNEKHNQIKEATVKAKVKHSNSGLQWLAAAPMLATIGVGVAIGAACGGAALALEKILPKPKRSKTRTA